MTAARVREERRPALLTVFGPAGIGKSRLAADWVARNEHVALVGRCLPYGEGITFWPVKEMLHADAAITVADARAEVTAKIRAAVLRAFGEGDADADAVARRLSVLFGDRTAAEAIPDVQPGDVPEELRWAVRRYVEKRAKTVLVLVFEDLQWAEAGLLDLIEHLAEWTRAPVLVVCLARAELLEVRPAWGGGRTNASAFTLEALDYEDTRALIGGLLGIPHPPTELVDDVCPRADYYVEGTSEAVERLDRVIEAARQVGPSEVLVRLLSQRGFIARADESADRFFEEGIAVARATGDPALIAHAMTLSNAQAWARGDLVAMEVVLREAYRFMKETGAKADLGICLVWLATSALQRGDFTGAQAHLDEAAAEAEASGSKFQLWAVRRLEARAAIARGEHGQAVRIANEVVALAHEVGAKRAVGLAPATTLAAVRDAEGDRAGAEKLYREALAGIAATGFQQLRVDIQRELARHYLVHGKPAEAEPLIQALVDFYRDPLAARRREEARALGKAAEATLSA